MPRYFFHVIDGDEMLDTVGTVLAGETEARAEAIVVSGEMLKDLDRCGLRLACRSARSRGSLQGISSSPRGGLRCVQSVDRNLHLSFCIRGKHRTIRRRQAMHLLGSTEAAGDPWTRNNGQQGQVTPTGTAKTSRENVEGLVREGRNRYQSRRSGRDVRVRLLRCARRHRVRNPNRSVRSLSSRKLPGATNRQFASMSTSASIMASPTSPI